MTAILSTEWDSVRQRDRLGAGAHGTVGPRERLPETERAELLGRLRWEVVQGRSLFLTYPQLLDGAAFAALRPAELLDELAVRAIGGGGVLPLRVNARDADLSGQLIAMLSTGFLFSSLPLPEQYGLRLQRELAARADRAAATELLAAEGPAGAADRLLAATGVLAAPLRRRIVARWRDWLEAADRGLLDVSLLVPADFTTAYALRPPPAPQVLASAAGRTVLTSWTSGVFDRAGLPNRSSLYDALDPLARSDAPEVRADARLLRDAFDETYYRAIAVSEGCALGISAPRRGLRRREVAALPASTPVVRFPTRFELRLGLLTAAQWQRYTDDAADALAGWWQSRDLAALQEVGDLLAGRTKEPPADTADELQVTRLQQFVQQARGVTAQMVAGGGMSLAAGLLGAGAPGAFAGGAGGALAPVVVAAVAAGAQRLTDFRGRYDVIELARESAAPQPVSAGQGR
ncbi:hypothetical protein [Streptomyces sp. VRA16 Mangrove soil]|uniref:hypothetical protein n=1 Tax=Streptomyces sp. VRA16 Mangrove soil TaxID=2817434 RepID=UPI001A9F9402|nr:hypothetical protein [Streptomyces sp. VRA16 Mangrove soil]MBO1335956.1 hypothetical protein [Streptomyces sp. VRA16 Mangrove soil]